MLTALQGRRHTVCTGVTVRQGENALTRAQHTDVYIRPATQRELKAYIAGGEPMDKAGAYGVQGQGALLVERIDGDFFNVMGLPAAPPAAAQAPRPCHIPRTAKDRDRLGRTPSSKITRNMASACTSVKRSSEAA